MNDDFNANLTIVSAISCTPITDRVTALDFEMKKGFGGETCFFLQVTSLQL